MRLLTTALSSILEQKLRSMLTMLGIIIGVAAVYAMLAIGNGAKQDMLEQFGGIGTRSISLSPDWSGGRASNRRPWRPFTEADVDAMRSLPGIEAVSGITNENGSVVVPGTDWQSDIRGTDQDYLAANDMEVSRGRNLTADDLTFSRTVAVLGETTAQRLFGESYPIGSDVVIERIPFEVVGTLEAYEPSWNNGSDPNDFILIPRTTARNRIMGDNWLVKNNVERIQIVGTDEQALSQIETEVDFILRRSRGLSAADAPDFRIFNFSANRLQFAQTQGLLSMLLLAMGAISLTVGGVGVMNIMLVSVAERTREIGLRLSVGARRSDILKQFLVESLVLCSIGGALGLALGFGLSELAESGSTVGREQVLSVAHSLSLAMLAFGSALFVGVVFGFLPARRASRLNPVDALRHE